MKRIHYCFYYDLDIRHLQPAADSVFPYLEAYDPIYVDCGRSALRLISALLGDGEILLGDYSCSSVEQGFPEPLKHVYYHVNDDFSIDFASLEAKLSPQTRAIYVNQFVGKKLSDDAIARLLALKERHGLVLIEDTAHSLLTAPLSFGDYGAAALYKWFPAASGGVFYSRKPLSPADRQKLQAMLADRTVPSRIYSMILGALCKDTQLPADTTLTDDQKDALYALADRFFDDFDPELTKEAANAAPTSLTALDRFLLSCCSVGAAQKQRRKNVEVLKKELVFDRIRPVFPVITDADCLLAYPVYIEPSERAELMAYLKERAIDTTVYWTMKPELPFASIPETLTRSRRILILPVQQQYDEHDMKRMADAINAWQAAKRNTASNG